MKTVPISNQLSFTLTLDNQAVKTAYQQLLKETAARTSLRGFRQGKAPLKLVEQNLDRNKLYQQVIAKLLPQAYDQEIKKRQIQPITLPKIEPLPLKPNQDWTFKVQVALKPTINLCDYQQKLKGLLKSTTLWLPGQKENQSKPEAKTEAKLAKIFDFLIDSIQVDLPPLLIEEEVNRSLSRLLQQINQLGLSLEQYLASIGKTADQLRRQQQKLAHRTLKLELILQEIAQDLKITVSPAEIDTLINNTPDAKVRSALQQPREKAYITRIIRKRKTTDQLINLAS